MGKYNDIWVKINELEESENEHKKKVREEKRKKLESQRKTKELIITPVEDLSDEEIIEGEEYQESSVSKSIDYMIVRDITPPPFEPSEPNLQINGALKKYKDRFGKYLAFIDCVKYFRSKEHCTILALATTSNVFMNIWGSSRNVSNAFEALEKIGLIKEYDGYYQTGMCKLYYYFVENERLLIEHCKKYNIEKLSVKNVQELGKKEKKEYQIKCKETYTDDFRKSVLFKSRLNLKRPEEVKPEQFKKDLNEMLYENYQGFKIYQGIADEINETFYKDQPDFKIKFKPSFHWNKEGGKNKSRSKIVGIGIRATNRLCSAKKDNDKHSNKILREEVLDKYGFEFEKDIKSSVPRVAYALNHGGWLKDDIDLYKKIYMEIDSGVSDEEFNLERDAIKKLFFRVYFDTTDNKLAYHTWDSMNQEGMNKESVYEDMIALRRAMETVIGKRRYDNYIFYVESCIYIDVLHTLLSKGYKVWLVYDCFYGKGFGTQEEFERVVLEAVMVSFVRFKTAADFNDWENIFKK